MGQARLKSLSVKGLRSFAAESTVTFPETGLTLFRGRNLDTGGSSGSGKSSLLLAITYLLGFCRYAGTALQSWLTEEPLEVTGTFQVDEGEVIITRGAKLSITLNNKKVAGSAKQLEDKITKLVGLPPELLAALTYRGQKQPGLFLSKTDSEKKEFLTTLLDLGKFETAVEQSQNKVKGLEQQLHTEEYVSAESEKRLKGYRENFKPALVADEKNLKSQLEQSQSHVDRVRKQVIDLRLKIKGAETEVERGAAKIRADSEPRIQKLQAEIEKLRLEVPDDSIVSRTAFNQLKADLDQAQGFLQGELTADQARYREQRQHADSVHAQLVLIEKKLATKPGLEKKLIQLGKDIEKLAQDVCDRCLRTWDQAAAEKAKAEAERADLTKQVLDIEALKPQIALLQKEYAALGEFIPSPVIEELRGITTDLAAQVSQEAGRIEGEIKLLQSEQQKRIAQAQADLQQARVGISSMIDNYRGDNLEKLQGAQEELETLEREQLTADSMVRGIQASLSRVQIDNARETERVAQLNAQIAQLETDLAATNKSVAFLRAGLNAELDFQKLIGREGFLGAIFDEVLWEISEETNRLLSQFPNTAHVTLHFRSESTSQKGTIKKSITPVVSIGGFEAPLSSGLSGGMETAVELAVDLAVAQVVSRRTGAVPGWLILDESFTGLGPVEAEASMEILRSFAEDKLVLVVDHASEFKSMFTQFVDVEYQGGFSRVIGEGT